MALAEQYYRMRTGKACRKAEEYCQKVLDAQPKDAVLLKQAQDLMERIKARLKELNW